MVLLLGIALAAPPWEPADWPPPAPGVSAAAPVVPQRPGLVEAAYRWYRVQSAKDGATCPYFPTCSAYGITAWRTWGFPVAIWLTGDRLMREYPNMGKHDDYPVVTPHGTPRFEDPVPSRPEK